MIQKAVILATRNDLTTGKLVETNSAAIVEQLFSAGIEVVAVLKVAYDKEPLLSALRQGVDLADMVIGTGGHGPSPDDIAAQVVAEYLAVNLVKIEELAVLGRGSSWTNENASEVRLPGGSLIIPNSRGEIPGFCISVGQEKTLVWLADSFPEVSAMLAETVMPWIAAQGNTEPRYLTSTFKLCGISEAELNELLRPLSFTFGGRFWLDAAYPELSLHFSLAKQETQKLEQIRDQIRQLLGSHIYAEREIPLEAVVGQLLLAGRHTLALAESCTGGCISHRITRVGGSSAYYYGGAVTYSNEAKIKFLGVRRETLERYGAVSRQTALEMSRGIRKRAQATIGLSVTGIAGPSGGTAEKPVGTVWMSLAREERHAAKLFRFDGEREHVIAGATQAALNWLRLELLES